MVETVERFECVGPDVSVVIPVLDEQRNLAPLMSEIAVAMRAAKLEFEVIFVDDGSATTASPNSQCCAPTSRAFASCATQRRSVRAPPTRPASVRHAGGSSSRWMRTVSTTRPTFPGS
jgi:hypothetical protein